LQVLVRDNNIDQALRVLKKKLQREGVFREMKARRAYEKPSEKRNREKEAAISRARKEAKKESSARGVASEAEEEAIFAKVAYTATDRAAKRSLVILQARGTSRAATWILH